MSMKNVMVAHGYDDLFNVLIRAMLQSSNGKGNERHGGDLPFSDQPIFSLIRDHGIGFATGQAAKKLGEAHTLLKLRGTEAAVNEILGAIVYAAAAVIQLEKNKKVVKADNHEKSEKSVPVEADDHDGPRVYTASVSEVFS